MKKATSILNDGKPKSITNFNDMLSKVEDSVVFNNTRSRKREIVYEAIDGERNYQDSLGPDRTDGKQRSVGDYITMMQYYQTKLVEGWTVLPGNDHALDTMRKIAGIAVHCMEDHGVIIRNTSSLKRKK